MQSAIAKPQALGECESERRHIAAIGLSRMQQSGSTLSVCRHNTHVSVKCAILISCTAHYLGSKHNKNCSDTFSLEVGTKRRIERERWDNFAKCQRRARRRIHQSNIMPNHAHSLAKHEHLAFRHV